MCRLTPRQNSVAWLASFLSLSMGATAGAAPTAYYDAVHNAALSAPDGSIHFQFNVNGPAARAAGTKVATFSLNGGALTTGASSPHGAVPGTLAQTYSSGAHGPTEAEGSPLTLLLFDANGNTPLQRDPHGAGATGDVFVVAGNGQGSLNFDATESATARPSPSPGLLVALGISSGVLVLTAYGWSRRGSRTPTMA